MTYNGVRIGLLALTLMAGSAAVPTVSAAAHPRITDSGTTGSATVDSGSMDSGTVDSGTVEEQRLDRAAPQEVLRRSGFDTVATEFARVLERSGSYARAERRDAAPRAAT